MSTNFPGGIDSFTNPQASDDVSVVHHATQHANANDSIAALEAKVGVNSSAVTTSHDYKLSGVTGSDKAASKAGSEALTNKTINGITPTAQAVGFTIAGGTTSKTLTVSLDATVSGTNTGDNATNSQYSGLAASKQDALVSGTNIKTVNSNSLLGSGDLVITAATPTIITVANEASDSTCFPLFSTAETGDLGPRTNAGLTFNSTNGTLAATGFSGPLTGNVTGNVTGNLTGNVTGNASTVTTNANLTGPITSSGNATSIASQTGTGTKFVVDTSPTLVTPVLGVATATSINKVAFTAPATSATLTIADGKTLTVNGDATITNGTHSGTNTGDQTSVSGNAGTVTNATFTTALTVNTGTVTLTGNAANTSVLTIGAGAVSVSGANTGDQVISDATLSTSDITTNNFTTAKHGFVPKGTNVGNFLKDDGTWSSPAGSGDVTGPASSTNNNVVTFNGTTGKIIKDSGLALSGSNTGDETTATIKTKLGAASSGVDGYLSGTDWTTFNGKGLGTVTAIGVATANGVSGSSSGGATPNLTISLGAITPTTVNGITLSGSATPTLAVTGTSSISGSNTGDQTSVSGNAGTVTNATFTTALTVNTGTITLKGNVANTSVLTVGAGEVSVSGSNTGDQTSVSGNAGTVTNATFTTALTVNTGTVTLSGNVANTSVLTIGAGSVSVSGSNTCDQTLSDATISTTDITTNDVSTSKHGFAPKAPNDNTKFLRGDATWAVPAGGSMTTGIVYGLAHGYIRS